MQHFIMKKKVMFASSAKRIKYGYLYNWYVTQGTGNASIIPADMESAGWGIPTYNSSDSFQILFNYVVGGQKLKSTDTYWNTPNTGAENKFNYNLRGAGRRTNAGLPTSLTNTTSLLTKDTFNSRAVFAYFDNIGNAYVDSVLSSIYGFSIRLVRPVGADSSKDDGTYCDDYVGNDGQKYKTVKIGTQVWLAENLAETKYRDGSSIPNVTDNTAWAALTTGARCAYNNDETNVFM